jgi:hypothetical protein
VRKYAERQALGTAHTEVKDASGKVVIDDRGKPVLKALPETCQPGETVPILPSKLNETYGISSLYTKMQEYLGEPASQHGPLGPRDFVPAQDKDFEDAYLRLLPYYIFADPATNPFVRPVGNSGEFGEIEQFEALRREAEFHKMTRDLDKGVAPFDISGGPGYVERATSFLDSMQKGMSDHRDLLYKRQFQLSSRAYSWTTKFDAAGDLVSFTGVMERAGRRCVDGHWETKEEWTDKLVQTYHALTVWHELGHLLGLDHNFMGSVDKANFPRSKIEILRQERKGIFNGRLGEWCLVSACPSLTVVASLEKFQVRQG